VLLFRSLYVAVSSCFPFSSDCPKAFRLDTWASKRPSFPLSVRKPTKRLERLNICRVLPIRCPCRIYWCFEVQTFGEFSTPSSPLWRILSTLSSPGVVNSTSHQRNKTVVQSSRPDGRFFTEYSVLGLSTRHRLAHPLTSTRLGTR